MIALACDHGGFELMQEVKAALDGQGHKYTDFGTLNSESSDYPVFGICAANAVASGKFSKGVLICGTGVGMSIVANKIPGIRAAQCSDTYTAEMARRHNDANVLTLGARVIDKALAIKIIKVFLSTDFEGGRHARRVSIINALEAN